MLEVGVPTRAHIRYQVEKVVPWAYKHYIRRMKPPACPARPDQLYKWAWDVQRERQEASQRRTDREEEEDNTDVPDFADGDLRIENLR
jgi:hypothetical protein